MAFQLTDPANIKDPAGLEQKVAEASRRMLFQPPRYKQKAEQKQFVEEFGKVMVANLDKVLNNSQAIVRVNAARMLSEVARMGYDAAGELCLKVLTKPDESDGVRHYAIMGLKYLFGTAEDPGDSAVQKGISVFNRDGQDTAAKDKNKDLERRCILGLIDYVTKKHDITPATPADEIGGIRYVRREAIRALGLVRYQSVRDHGQFNVKAIGRPALVLLRVANRDIPAPEPSNSERIEAIIGFCQLLTDKERDLNLDYAVYWIGMALVDLGKYRLANPADVELPWKRDSVRLNLAMSNWAKHVDEMRQADAPLVKALFSEVDSNLLSPIEKGLEGVSPNPTLTLTWLQSHAPKSTSLFKNDPETVIRPPAADGAAPATGGR